MDLKNIFYTFEKIIPNYNKINGALLSLNYRLNSKVLRLTNFFQYFIRELFPNTIDKIQDDFSIKVTSFIPTFVTNLNFLINPILYCQERYEGENLTLSNYHCFICRTTEEKQLILKKYNKNIKVNDILECKGLEYEIVVIYNFFKSIDENYNKSNDNYIKTGKDKILKMFETRKNKKFKNYESIFNFLIDIINVKHEDNNIANLSRILEKENINEIACSFDDFYRGKTDSEIMYNIINEHKDFIYPDFSKFENKNFDKHLLYNFCTILKQLYVMMTRAQTFLIFYEENGLDSRFLKYCIQKGLISTKENELEKNIINYFKDDKRIIKDPKELEIKAEKAFKNKRYGNAKY